MLKEKKIINRTVIIFTSDNGGLLGVTNNFPLRSGKGYPYEGGVRVPFIITWPEVISKGKRYSIEDVKSFEELVQKFEEGDKLAIVGRRNNNRFFVAVTVE